MTIIHDAVEAAWQDGFDAGYQAAKGEAFDAGYDMGYRDGKNVGRIHPGAFELEDGDQE